MLHALLIALAGAGGLGLGGVNAAIAGVTCYARTPREHEREQETGT